jgi:hypothetical protein
MAMSFQQPLSLNIFPQRNDPNDPGDKNNIWPSSKWGPKILAISAWANAGAGQQIT